AVSRAGSYLATRAGRTAVAVEDTEGRMSGVHIHWTFPTASVVKAMLLVAYLRHLDAMGQRTVDSGSNSFLYPMIHISDNGAATKTWSIVGDSGLYAIARAAGMTDFSVSGFWLSALLSPADQAHFFFEMDSLIAREFVGYARYLLSTIEPSQSWGIPVVARPLGYQTFFKDGSEPTGLGQLVHQVDRLRVTDGLSRSP
ncbi:MAG: class A beta-lactamase-related serine hydrolase, partial [Actinomycetota bacterium]|nr:class A beta-lactamase-related serine hydrolase [Actinomycetota bacterium]